MVAASSGSSSNSSAYSSEGSDRTAEGRTGRQFNEDCGGEKARDSPTTGIEEGRPLH